ncbi:MAG: transcriptional regulator PpsR [Pseudomonadota bacterium]
MADRSARVFNRSADLFDRVGGRVAAELVSQGAPISLVLTSDGRIEDVAFRDADLAAYGLATWHGANWHDTVTEESREKIADLLRDAGKQKVTRARQVNHPAQGLPDLPVRYRLVSLKRERMRLAIGEDLREMAAVQQRLVETQFELEADYRKIREAEGRYRTTFQLAALPSVVVDGQSRKVIDANRAASKFFGRPTQKLTGQMFASLAEGPARDTLAETLDDCQQRGQGRTARIRFADQDKDATLTIEPYRENGQTNLLVSIATKSDAKGRTETALSALPSLDWLPESAVRTDSDGTIREVNALFLDLVQLLNAERAIGRKLNNWVGASAVDMQVLLGRVLEEKRVRGFSTVVRDDLGSDRPILVSAHCQEVPPKNGERGAKPHQSVVFLLTDVARRDLPVTLQMNATSADSSEFSELVGRVPLKELIREAVDVIEKMCIEAALRQTDNNRALAADMLGLSRQSLYIKLKRYGLADYGHDD